MSGAALNRRLRDEAFERYSVHLLYWRTKVQILTTQLAFERALRHHMKKIVDEVVLFMK